jgi:hypothetical protein
MVSVGVDGLSDLAIEDSYPSFVIEDHVQVAEWNARPLPNPDNHATHNTVHDDEREPNSSATARTSHHADAEHLAPARSGSGPWVTPPGKPLVTTVSQVPSHGLMIHQSGPRAYLDTAHPRYPTPATADPRGTEQLQPCHKRTATVTTARRAHPPQPAPPRSASSK